LLLAYVLAGPANAAEPRVTYGNLPEVVARFTKVYRPTYSYEETSQKMQGRGVYRMYVDASGVVTKVGVLKSAGHMMLDRDAANALIHWKAKPGRRFEVDIPIRFSLP
jgi:TonB family protein